VGFSDERGFATFDLMRRLWPGVQAYRDFGSAALGIAYAATGRLDLFAHHFLYPWDLAAGIAQVREAGGVITDRDGLPASLAGDSVIAGGPAAHSDFMRLTQSGSGLQ
jgi:myo-inositol-1(or 4)-monophosphatase